VKGISPPTTSLHISKGIWAGGPDSMRGALGCLGLFALMAVLPGIRHQAIDVDRAIPRFILHKGEWICVDHNPRQIDRKDCAPRSK